MNEVEIKKLWDLLTSKYDMGTYTYEEFKKRMSTPEGVKGFYTKYGKELGLDNTQEKIVKTKYVTQYPNQTSNKKAFKSKPCDENVFPWTYGCKNNKIGQMNMVYFGDRYGDIFGDELNGELLSLGYYNAPGQKKGEITQFIYDEVMKDSLQESEKLERKKIVKETVKNILKERLKNN